MNELNVLSQIMSSFFKGSVEFFQAIRLVRDRDRQMDITFNTLDTILTDDCNNKLGGNLNKLHKVIGVIYKNFNNVNKKFLSKRKILNQVTKNQLSISNFALINILEVD